MPRQSFVAVRCLVEATHRRMDESCKGLGRDHVNRVSPAEPVLCFGITAIAALFEIAGRHLRAAMRGGVCLDMGAGPCVDLREDKHAEKRADARAEVLCKLDGLGLSKGYYVGKGPRVHLAPQPLPVDSSLPREHTRTRAAKIHHRRLLHAMEDAEAPVRH